MKRAAVLSFILIIIFLWNSRDAPVGSLYGVNKGVSRNYFKTHRSWDDLNAGEHEVFGSEKEEKYPVINPFAEVEKWENHYSVSCLGFYEYVDYPNYTSTSCLPVYFNVKSKTDNRSLTTCIPFASSEIDNDYYSFSILGIAYQSSGDRDSYERSCCFPFFNWGGSYKKNNSYQMIVPLLLYHSTDLSQDSGESLWIHPLIFSRTHWTGGKDDEYIRWLPIIPLTYHRVDSCGGHRNFLWLMDYSWITVNGEDSLERFWLLPLFMWHAGSNGYTSIVPPVYIHNRYTNGDYYCHFLPFFASWEEMGADKIRQIITPLFGSRKVTDAVTGRDLYANFFFPLLPVFFRSRDSADGTHTNILWLFDFVSNNEGEMESFSFIPLIFHEFKYMGYRIYIPFFIRLPGSTEQEGASFGLFHYHRWSRSDEAYWFWLYYHSEKYVLPETGRERTDENVIPAEFYTHVLPVYWSWKNRENSGRVVLPLYLEYRDSNRKLHVNLAGIAVNTLTGPFRPDLLIGLEKKEERWYLDTDVSWFYDIVSFSWRNTVSGGNYKNSDMGEFVGPYERPVSLSKLSTDRDESINFFGWDFLFGWMAYRHADTRKHWRILPLAWLTYNETSDDRLYMFLPPLYISYYSEETDEGYLIIAPFYASQRERESYRRGYLVNLYWDEYDAAGDYREISILWPFINLYYSPDKSGFRLFPLFWYGKWKEEGNTSSRSISLLHYSMSIRNSAGDYTYRFRINPLYCLGESSGDTTGRYRFFAPVIPLFYYSEENGTGENGLKFNDSISISPFHLYSRHSWKNKTDSTESSTLMVPLLPLFYRSRSGNYTHWNFLGVFDRCTDDDYSRFFAFPFFYTTQDGNIKHRNIFGIIDWETGSDSGGSSMFLPFYLWHGGEESMLVIPPMVSYFSSGKDWGTIFVAGIYRHYEPGYERNNILMLYDHAMYMTEQGAGDKYGFIFSMIEVDIAPEVRKMRIAWGALLNYSKSMNPDSYHFDALLWLAGSDNDNGGFHSRLLPLWYYQSYPDNSWQLYLPPILSWFSNSSNGRNDRVLFGALYYRDENRQAGEDRRMVLLGILWNEVKHPERQYHSCGSLWGVLWDYETEGESDFKKFTILKGLIKYVEFDGKGHNSCLWL